jgi:hypothetical protein
MSDQPVLALALDDVADMRCGALAAALAPAGRERPSALEWGPAGRGERRVERRTMTRPARPA